jgi:DNA-binding CsgD family transcriptional regulator
MERLATPEGLLRDAHDALRRGAWAEGRAGFEAANTIEEAAEAYDGLATCCRFMGALDESLAARERAFRLFRERGDVDRATIAAAWLGRDAAAPGGEASIARAWFAVARRLLERTDSPLARGTVCYYEGQFALLGEIDAPRGGDLGAEARACGRECGDLDLEMQGLSLQGLALVAEGRVEEGMVLVEEAAAAVLGGELSGADVAGWICCHLIYACERVSDTRRAAEWCGAMRGFCERWEMPGMFGMCRAHHGSVLISEGRWEEAETEFIESARLFAANLPALGYEPVLRLAELRVRQGRLEEAEALAAPFRDHPLGWQVLPQLAAVAFERDEREAALAMLDRYVRSLPERDRTLRVRALELMVRVNAEGGEPDRAENAAAELVELAAEAGTERLRGSAELARGRLLHARGDAAAARLALENATDLYGEARAPFEAACARTELGRVLLELGERRQAVTDLRAARDALETLGADSEAKRAARALAAAESTNPRDRWGLSGRELDVLRLVADGLSNGAIGERLVISPHTVHRHMANIRVKLGADSKAAAVARATRAGLI